MLNFLIKFLCESRFLSFAISDVEYSTNFLIPKTDKTITSFLFYNNSSYGEENTLLYTSLNMMKKLIIIAMSGKRIFLS